MYTRRRHDTMARREGSFCPCCLLLSVVAVGVGAAAVAVVSIVTPRLLPVPLPEPVADKATGLVVGGKLLLLAAVGAAVSHVAASAVALQ